MKLHAELRAWRLAGAHLLAALILPPYSFRRVRAMVYRLGGVRIPPGVEVSGGVQFAHPNVAVGRGVFFGPGAQLVATDTAPIEIGNGVGIGPRTQIFTPTHAVGGPERRCGTWSSEGVTIEDGAWIGAGAMVLAGVTIGAGAIVAAGAVVTGDIPPNVFAAGVPARALRALD